MNHVVKIEGRYYYNRRVPESVKEFDPRRYVRVSLKTDSRNEARQRAAFYNEQIEAYWKNLVTSGQRHDNNHFQKAVRIARQMGFSYQPMSTVAALPLLELVERLLALKDLKGEQVQAALGAKPEPQITLRDALERFWGLAKDKVIDKSEQQIRKWKNPRRKAVENFISIVGNKDLKDITREDIVAFRDWWLVRIKTEKKNRDSANKNLIQLRAILEMVSDDMKLGLDIEHLFKKIFLKNKYKKGRLPFTTEEIINLLNSDKLDNTHVEIKRLLYIMAETGARPSELLALRPEDIRLDTEIPHIIITDRGEDESLKTSHSEREIPLTGYALKALQEMPDGFSHYRNKSDNLTTNANKFLRTNNLFPSEKHSVYSLRHSFQDRILSVDAPDRVQTALMGHKFNRPSYGNGPSLEQKMKWMRKICLLTG